MRQFLTPKWLLSHAFVLAMVVLMVNLGFWQLDRLDDRKDRNAEVRLAINAEAAPIETLLDTDPLDHTATLVAGEYLTENSFFVANRSFEGQAGLWLATPVRLDDGRVVVVSRGWVPRLWASGDDTREIDTPIGRIEILGRIQASVPDGRIGGRLLGDWPEVSRMDLAVIEEMLAVEVEDQWVQLVRQAPPLDEIPVPVPAPSLDEGPHLSYAFQWFFFSTATVVAYALILRTRWREPSRE